MEWQCKMQKLLYKDEEAAWVWDMSMEVEKRFRWCFEDAVDPDKKVDVHGNRFG